MPSFVTHKIFAQEVLETLEHGDLRDAIESHLGAFFWGAQGPDLLFFRSAGTSELSALGSLMHCERTDSLFLEMSRYLGDLGDTEEYAVSLAYAAGFICHYCLDATVHPYVYFREYKRRAKVEPRTYAGIHHRLESDIDSEVYAARYHEKVGHFDVRRTFRCSGEEKLAISGFYVYLFSSVYQLPVDEHELLLSFQDGEKLMRYQIDRTGLMYYVAKLLDTCQGTPNKLQAFVKQNSVGYDILNIRKKPWYNVNAPEIIRHDSVVELMGYAKNQATAMLSRFYDCVHQGAIYMPSGLPSFDDGNFKH